MSDTEVGGERRREMGLTFTNAEPDVMPVWRENFSLAMYTAMNVAEVVLLMESTGGGGKVAIAAVYE